MNAGRGALGAALHDALGRFAGAIAAIDRAGAHPYAALDAQAAAVARALAGCSPDEPVILRTSNRASDLAAFIGVWRAGGVVVPAHRSMPAAVLDELVQLTHARFIIDGAGVPPVQQIAGRPPERRPLLDDAAFVIFTSGSTGRPKGVVLSHQAFHNKLEAIDGWLGLSHTSRMLLVLQITFSFGIWTALLTLLRGGLLVIEEKFEPHATLAALRAHRVSVAALVPTMLRTLAASLDAKAGRVETLERILTGGEPFNPGLIEPMGRLFPNADLLDIYGLTETSTCDFLLEATGSDRPATPLGHPTPGVACRIADADGKDVPTGTVGELLLRTRFIMTGYLDDPPLTRAAFHGDWFRTGDLARLDGDGRVRLAGRAKELILRGANKVSPLEIELVMQRHPSVAAALATGVPDERLGERIHLLVMPRAGAQLDEAALRDWAARHLERFKCPDAIHLGTELPAGRTGKADRMAFRQLILSGRLV